MWAWILGAVLLAVVAVGFVQHRARRGIYVPLSKRQPARRMQRDTPLGMEATDMDVVNAVNRRNESLERGHTNWTNRGNMAAATDVPPMADDETYAKQYYTAFQNNTKGPKTSGPKQT